MRYWPIYILGVVSRAVSSPLSFAFPPLTPVTLSDGWTPIRAGWYLGSVYKCGKGMYCTWIWKNGRQEVGQRKENGKVFLLHTHRYIYIYVYVCRYTLTHMYQGSVDWLRKVLASKEVIESLLSHHFSYDPSPALLVQPSCLGSCRWF